MIKQISAWAVAAFFGVVVVGDAMALTLKKGEVLSDGKVMSAGETKSAKNNIEQKGYHIGGGQLHIGAGGVVASIDLNELAGKSEEDVKQIIIDAVGEEIASALDAGAASELAGSEAAQAALAASLAAEGVVNGGELSHDELVDAILDGESIGNISEEAHREAFEAAAQAKGGWYDLQDGNGPQCQTNC